jgi:predicted DCC family thiol-disulfide oxidoreductase YuxK
MDTQNEGQGPGRNDNWIFYYDGVCGFCVRAVRGLSCLDLRNLVTWTPYQSLESPPRGLTWDDLNTAAYLDTGEDHLYEGFYAFRMLTLKLLPLFPLAPLFWLPGAHWPGVALYRWIARNRRRLSACRIPGIGPGRSSKPSR